jgi:hypothetical protein
MKSKLIQIPLLILSLLVVPLASARTVVQIEDDGSLYKFSTNLLTSNLLAGAGITITPTNNGKVIITSTFNTNGLASEAYTFMVSTNATNYTLVTSNALATIINALVSAEAATRAAADYDIRVFATNLASKPYINVLSYGAVLTNCLPPSSTFNRAGMTPIDTALKAAIAAAAASNGRTNSVYIPSGIGEYTNTFLAVPAGITLCGDGLMWVGGYPGVTHTYTSGYSMLWFSNTNFTGILMTNAADANQYIMNLQIRGGTNPVLPIAEQAVVPSTQLAKCGIQIGDTIASWTGGEMLQNLGISGFRVAARVDSGQSLYDSVSIVGCDVGFVSCDPSPSSAMGSQMITAGYGNIWTNSITNLLVLGGWQYAQADNARFVNCSFSWRSNGVATVFQGLRQARIQNDTSFQYAMAGIWLNCDITVESTFNEVTESTSHLYGATNLFVFLSSCNVTFQDCQFNYNGNSAISTNAYGHSMTNFALIYCPEITGASDVTFIKTKSNSHWPPVGNRDVLLRSYYSAATFVGTYGLLENRATPATGNGRRFTYIGPNAFWPGWVRQLTTLETAITLTTNIASDINQLPFGGIGMMMGDPYELYTVLPRAGGWNGSGWPSPYADWEFRNVLTADGFVPGQDSFLSTTPYNTRFPKYYTVDRMRSRGDMETAGTNRAGTFQVTNVLYVAVAAANGGIPYSAAGGYSIAGLPCPDFGPNSPHMSIGSAGPTEWLFDAGQFANVRTNYFEVKAVVTNAGTYTWNLAVGGWTNNAAGTSGSARFLNEVSRSVTVGSGTNTVTLRTTNVWSAVITPYTVNAYVYNTTPSQSAVWFIPSSVKIYPVR